MVDPHQYTSSSSPTSIMVYPKGRYDKLCEAYTEHQTDTFRFIADHTTPSKGPGIKQVWLDPAPAELFSEQLLAWMKVASVTPARIPGYWMDKPGYESTPLGTAATPGEKIILSLHGGAYIRLSASPKDIVANIAKGILQHTPSVKRTFAVEYRLSKTAPDTSTHAFPAALLDALAGYIYLIKNVGVAPQDIILTGDSAGANLAQALTRYLIDTRSIISYLPPPPSSLLLLSPWADLSNSHVPAWECRDNVDYLGAPDSAMSHYARNAFFGAHGPQIGLSPYVSPATISPAAESSSFVGFPRTMIVTGGAEALIPSITTLKERMSRDLGNKLVYYEAKDAVHDFLVFVFWEPERTEALHAISKWIGD